MQRVFLTADLGFGDGGKGSIVDYLVRRERAGTVVRYNGGAQAGHHVVLSDGRSHVFSQFGSGALVDGVKTHLSRFMLIEPIAMMDESRRLKELGCDDAFSRVTIDRDALLITPFHVAANRLIEMARNKDRHGSCGMGIGETMEDFLELGLGAPHIHDLFDQTCLVEKFRHIQARKREKIRDVLNELPSSNEVSSLLAYFDSAYDFNHWLSFYAHFLELVTIVDGSYLGEGLKDETVVFEGAQGILLDQMYGFSPYNTWTDITFNNAQKLLDEARYDGGVKRIGIMRGYFTRHGAGPFVTEDVQMTDYFIDVCNKNNAWQGGFRVGHFDMVALRYALDVIGGVDELAITNLDRIISYVGKVKICTQYTIGEEVVSRLGVARPTSVAHQERLTARLMNAVPLYTEEYPCRGTKDTIKYAKRLGELSGVSPTIISFGPTAEDKMLLNTFLAIH
ncbi:MAG: adenylosuccinate synthetase [Parcubacteria group bacterium]|nr:adenylosuccinate synthetase [Parcubacteria group bacterium]